jgi:tetratricopeptide (TPR) repeat protein
MRELKEFGARQKLVREVAESGEQFAQIYLGQMYFDGDGVPQNIEEGARWSAKAAEQGDVELQNNLGQRYLKGRDFDEAAKWLLKAARQGHAVAQNSLGACRLAAGDNVEAVEWFRKAADQGHAGAQEQSWAVLRGWFGC